MPTHRFFIPTTLLERPVTVWLLGAGGTGSELLDGLARLHAALLALGHPGGLQVTVWDGDLVSTANLGRQRFWPVDVGYPKATVLVQRLNLFAGLAWEDRPVAFQPESAAFRPWPDLLITCVDRAAVRAALGQAGASAWTACLWLDCGNGAFDGQVILGHLSRRAATPLRLPSVYDFYGPALAGADDRDDAPSCGLAAALGQQSLVINRIVADAALALLYELFRNGGLERHGQWIDLARGLMTPLPIDPAIWAFLGYAPAAPDEAAVDAPVL